MIETPRTSTKVQSFWVLSTDFYSSFYVFWVRNKGNLEVSPSGKLYPHQ